VLLHDYKQAHSRMKWIDQVVFVSILVNVDVVIVIPARWPWLDKFKPVTAILEAAIVSPPNAKYVFVAEI
jgi:hypothetical protein